MQEAFDALESIILPAMESGNYSIAPLAANSLKDDGAFIEAYPHDKEMHSYYEWLWLLSGEAHMKIEERIYHLQPGDFCFLPPMTRHADIYNRDTPAYTSLWFFHFGNLLAFRVFSYQPLGRQHVGHFHCVHAPGEIGRVLVELQKEMPNRAPYSSAVVRGLLLYLAALLSRIAVSARQQGVLGDSYGPVSCQIVAFLHQNYARELTLAEIAASMFLTPNYLSTVFKQESGITITEALARIRINHAIRLLVENKMPLAAVAEAVGYNSLDRFSRVFRRFTGVAPRHYGK